MKEKQGMTAERKKCVPIKPNTRYVAKANHNFILI